MEYKYKFWLAMSLLSLAFIVTLSTLIFSPYTAKFKTAMKLRDKYVSTIFNIRKILGYNEADFCWYFRNPVSPLRKNDDGTYNYALVGKIVGISDVDNTITLECSNKREYKLYTKISKTNDPNWLKIDIGVNTKAEKPRENPLLFFEPNLDLSFKKDPYFKKDQLYMAIWKDGRELTEINKSIKNSDNVFVNTFDNFVISLLRY